jgi:hypothetical protein
MDFGEQGADAPCFRRNRGRQPPARLDIPLCDCGTEKSKPPSANEMTASAF